MGVGDLPKSDNEAAKKKTEQSHELDVFYAKTFNSQSGKKVLKHLRDTTIERPNLQITDGIAGVLTGYVMEGRSSLVRDIEKRIKDANSGGVQPFKQKNSR